jgi:hypothetical protein
MAENVSPPVITTPTDKISQAKGEREDKISQPKSAQVTILGAARLEKMQKYACFSYMRPTKKTVRGSLGLFTVFGAGANLIDRDDWEWLIGETNGTPNDNQGLIATGQVFLILDGLHIYRDAVNVRTISGGLIPREEWINQCYSPDMLTTWRDQIEKRLKAMDEGKITPPRYPSFSEDTGLTAFY